MSYDPRPTDLWLAEQAFDQAAALVACGVRYLERAGVEDDIRHAHAYLDILKDRQKVRIERMLRDGLDAQRVADGLVLDDG